MKTVLIGQGPSRFGDPRQPLMGRTGRQLRKLAGISRARYLRLFERRNLLQSWFGKNGKGDDFPAVVARHAARMMIPGLRGRKVIFLGRAVAKAFGFGEGFFRWRKVGGFRAAVFPHPSGVSHWWNDLTNARMAAKFLRKQVA